MKKKSNKIWWILGGVVMALTLLLWVAKAQGWIGKEKATEVEFTKVIKSDITESISASGKVQPEVEVKISPDVPGEIIGLYVKEGDSVKKGQLLLKIKPENYVSAVDRGQAIVNQTKASAEQAKSTISQAEARLMKAQMEYNRQKKLFEDKVVSSADMELAETNLKVSKQDVESAKANLQASDFNIKSAEASLKDASTNLIKTTIYAPMNGIISKLDVKMGERVVGTSQMAGTELLRIANLNNMEVRVNVNENDIVRASMGDTAIIDVDSYSSTGKKFKGIIYEIANTANGSTTTSATSTDAVTEFEVKIRILPESYRELVDRKAKKYPFKPGMTATVDIVTDKKMGVLSVPIAAVTTRSKDDKKDDVPVDDNALKVNQDKKTSSKKDKPKEIVFINDNGKAKIREVKTGITDTNAGTIEITSGLAIGEEIISGPFIAVSKKLKDGEAVMKKIEVKKK